MGLCPTPRSIFTRKKPGGSEQRLAQHVQRDEHQEAREDALELLRVEPVRECRAPGRGDHRHRDHHEEGRHVDRADRVGWRIGHLCQQEGHRRGRGDGHAKARRRRHRAVNGHPVQRQHRRADRAAADAKEHRGEAHQRPEPGAEDPARQVIRDPPACLAEGHVAGDAEHQHAEDQLQRLRAQLRNDQDAGDRADGDRRRPLLQDRPVDGAAAVVRQHRADRGDDDRGKRGRDADLHQVVRAVAEPGEEVVEGRHQNDAAADAEKPGEDASEGADRHQDQQQRQKRVEMGHAVLLRARAHAGRATSARAVS
ncbi:hypothetical protein SDC9_25062 [bioreactor metagenome]|uniref:Uncharacterized protein n=1 Tax=bioreactor metagenome TaxID=1076179 RepID=A0A644UJJ4_9ZZZZ